MRVDANVKPLHASTQTNASLTEVQTQTGRDLDGTMEA